MVTQAANAACFQLGRERFRSLSIATQVCTPLRGCRVSDFASLRLTPDTPSVPLRPSPLCFTLSAHPRSLGKAVSRHCYAEPRRFCAVSANAVRLGSCSLNDDHRFTLTPCNVVIAQSGTLVARYLALPLSPSFASPPPSLRSGTSPAGGLISLSGVCPPSFRHRLRRSLHNGGHKSGWVRFLCGVG